MDWVAILRAILASIFVLFMPGFAWTLVFFRSKQIDTIERIALSVGLSIALVTLSIFFLNTLVGIKITVVSSTLTIAGLTVVPLAYYYLRKSGVISGKQIVENLKRKLRR